MMTLGSYLFYLSFEIVGVIAILHEEDNIFRTFSVLVEFHDVLMLELGVDNALLSSVVYLDLVHQPALHNTLLYHILYSNYYQRITAH